MSWKAIWPASFVLVVALLTGGCGGGADSNATGTAANQSRAAASAAANTPKPIGMVPCHVRSGGSNVEVRHVSCRETGHLLRHWNPSPALVGNRPGRHILLSRRGGWQCWARLEKKGGPITNVCWHGSQVIVYSFS